jgi:hypothetical protein
MAVAPAPGAAPEIEFRGIQLWNAIESLIRSVIGESQRQVRYRRMTVNIPLVPTLVTGALPVTGWITSFGIGFHCRVIGYQIFALVAGSITVDLMWSSNGNIAGMASMIGVVDPAFPEATHFPSLSGTFTENLDTSGWLTRELSDGDQVHVFILTAATLQQATMVLFLQDLDEQV